jgi:hypothetical protein
VIHHQILRRAAGLVIAGLALAAAPEGVLVAQSPAAGEGTTAAATPLWLRGKQTTRGQVESQLSAPVREALDQWAEAAERLDLAIHLGQAPEYIVLGRAQDDVLTDATKWMDDTFALLDGLVPLSASRSRKATIAILVDEKLVHSKGWGELLSELQQRKLLVDKAVDYLRDDPEGVTFRSTPLFLQPTFDLTGEGEFQLGNEVAHKFAQCLLTIRTGQQPDEILWGLGYVVEQRLFESSYHYRLREFVYTSSHFDWKREARKQLDSRRKAKNFSFAPFALDDATAGKPQASQLLVWAALSYLSQADPPALSGMLLELSAIQAEADPYGVAPSYSGDPGRTREALVRVGAKPSAKDKGKPKAK